MLTAALLTNSKTMQPKCIPTDKQKNKMWHIHTTEYYSAIKRRDALIHPTIWMNPENTVLSEKARHKRSHAI